MVCTEHNVEAPDEEVRAIAGIDTDATAPVAEAIIPP